MSIFAPQEIFTPQYQKLQDIRAAHERAHWIVDEVDLRTDVEQWKTGKITDEEKAFILMVLRLFTQADTDICAAYVDKLLPMYKAPDVRMMLLSFAGRETTHMLGYRHLNATLGYDSHAFMSEFLNYDEMKKKHEFFIEDVPLETPAERISYLAKQALMEGTNLFASFAMLMSFSQAGKAPGMVSVNAWSSADESYHVEGLSELFRLAIEEHPKVVTNAFKAEVYETLREIVRLEDAFVDLCYSVGKNSNADPDAVKQYVRYIGDYRMIKLGFKPQFGIKENPLPWMDLINGNTMNNFFEVTSVQYSKASLTGDWVY